LILLNEIQNQKIPVLVYIHGGGFTSGSGSLEIYNPSVLVARGNVLFVAVQYRLGAFGFISMGTNSFLSGNAGLFDQVN
jgi:carboxylesterase type B